MTAALAFKVGGTRDVMKAMVEWTDSDGFVVAEGRKLARELLVSYETVKGARLRLISDGVLRRTDCNTRFEWDADRLSVLAGEVLSRLGGAQKRATDGNECSQLPEISAALDALAAAYVQVFYSEKGFNGTPPRPRLGQKNRDEGESLVADYFARLTSDLSVSIEALAVRTVRKFAKSKSARLAAAGFPFSFLPWELRDLEKSVRHSFELERSRESSPMTSSSPASELASADFIQAQLKQAGLR